MVGGPGAAMPGGATLFGLSGPRLRQLGIAFLIVGFLLFLLSFIPIFLAFNNFMANPFGSTGSMFGSFFLSFLIGALGIFMIGIGGFALRLGLVRPSAATSRRKHRRRFRPRRRRLGPACERQDSELRASAAASAA